MSAIVELREVEKSFPGTRALRGVSLQVERGSVHGLVGENGAGKSTLGKIVAGSMQPDAGRLLVEGKPVRFRSPRDAIGMGIMAIQQEIVLVPQRTVLENVFLGIETSTLALLRERRMTERFRALMEESQFELEADVPVSSLSIADQQKVEILRAVARSARVIVMDEPTAALNAGEKEKLRDVVVRLRERGTTIIYVSHFLDEVLGLADSVTVLRDGAHVRTSAAESETVDSLVEAMLGRSLTRVFPAKRPPPEDAPTVLSVKGLSREDAFEDVSFEVRAGEIVGLAGLVGSGRSELAHVLFGAARANGGAVRCDGEAMRLRSPRDGVRAGLVLLPEDRKAQGLLLDQSVTANVTLPRIGELSRAGIIPRRRAERETLTLLERLAVRAPRGGTRVRSLSGGNQQKVLFAKWLFRTPRVLVIDEPTRGVDVDGKQAIYELIAAVAADGLAIVLISSELEEILGLSHRVVVMRRGRVAASLAGEEATEAAIMRAAFGGTAVAA